VSKHERDVQQLQERLTKHQRDLAEATATYTGTKTERTSVEKRALALQEQLKVAKQQLLKLTTTEVQHLSRVQSLQRLVDEERKTLAKAQQLLSAEKTSLKVTSAEVRTRQAAENKLKAAEKKKEVELATRETIARSERETALLRELEQATRDSLLSLAVTAHARADAGADGDKPYGWSLSSIGTAMLANADAALHSDGGSENPTNADMFMMTATDDDHHRHSHPDAMDVVFEDNGDGGGGDDDERDDVGPTEQQPTTHLTPSAVPLANVELYKGPVKLPLPAQYRSPLVIFRAYRLSSHFPYSRASPTFSSKIDPHQTLCRFELFGRCNDPSCEYQHARDMTMDGTF
jgi:hypothetical protein